jgi:mono/diheme cytochrome c family protein
MTRFHVQVGWMLAVVLFPAAAVAQTTTPSFTKDIAPIMYSRCATCHRPGEVAPMSLMSYTEVRPWVRAIKAKVVSRQMPPWHAEGEAGKWHNDRRLTQAEIDTIAAWVDAGAAARRRQQHAAAATVRSGVESPKRKAAGLDH